MSINPPSDIVLGVANAADPQKLRDAAAQLASATGNAAAVNAAMAAAAVPPASSEMGAAPMKPKPAFDVQTVTARPVPPKPAKTAVKPEQEAYKKFEAYLVQTFVESMLPKDAPNVYGSGPAGNIWRSMMAEHLANEIAKGTAFGIAEQIAKHRQDKNKVSPAAETAAPNQAAAIGGERKSGTMSSLQDLLTAEAHAAQAAQLKGRGAAANKG